MGHDGASVGGEDGEGAFEGNFEQQPALFLYCSDVFSVKGIVLVLVLLRGVIWAY